MPSIEIEKAPILTRPICFYKIVAVLQGDTALTKTDVGTSYVDFDTTKCYLLPYIANGKGRLLLSRHSGNEAGLKGIRLQNVTDGETLVEVTWSGIGETASTPYISDVFTFPDNGKDIRLQVKASSSTEDITLRNCFILMC
jgi:hypothetical protein